MFARTGRACPVDENPEQPGLERRTPLEPVDAADDAHPGVLYRLFGHGLTGDHRAGQAEHGLLVAGHEHDERVLVPVAQAAEQLDVRLHDPKRRPPQSTD